MPHRRYALPEILSKAKSAGFEILRVTHLGFSIYPAFWAVKKWNLRYLLKSEEQKRNIVAKQIRQTKNSFLMKSLIELEMKVGTFVNFPCGIRCVLKCRK